MSNDGDLKKRKNVKNDKNRKSETIKDLNYKIEKNDRNELHTNELPIYIFLLIFVFRILNALSIKTYFQPDEYYQSLEPAHNLAFSYGYITWEWKEKLRSSIHPIIYAIGYKLVGYLTDNSGIIILTPKVISAAIATIGEYYTYQFARAFSKDEVLSKVTLILSLLSSFNWFFITRSFSNGFEMVLTTIAFSYWPWDYKLNRKMYLGAFFAFISCIIRPPNCLLWLYLGTNLLLGLYKIGTEMANIAKITLLLLLELVVTCTLITACDIWFYGEVTFPLYNFIEFNIIKNLSIFYGVAPWHFYLFQAVPLILMTYLPFFLHALFKLKHYKSTPGQAGLVVVLGFSLIDHKEIRFIYTLMPIFLLFTAYSIVRIVRTQYIRQIVIIGVVLNCSIAYFLTQVNERGVIDVMDYLRDNQNNIESFGFLTPCHSTPWQSQLHSLKFNSATWFLTCEPPIHLQHATEEVIRTYRDESDQFYDNPIEFFQLRFPPLENIGNDLLRAKDSNDSKQTSFFWPARIIIFEPLEPLMDSYLDMHYVQCQRFFNSYFHWDSRRTGDVIVYCLK